MTATSTVVIRHPRELISKCSLTPVEGRVDTVDWLRFLSAHQDLCFDADGYTELAVDAEPLSLKDRSRPLLLLDSTWRLLPKVRSKVVGVTVKRSIPNSWCTAYPRVSRDGSDPTSGLASIEALFVAQALLGNMMTSLLDGYYWRDGFLDLNSTLLEALPHYDSVEGN